VPSHCKLVGPWGQNQRIVGRVRRDLDDAPPTRNGWCVLATHPTKLVKEPSPSQRGDLMRSLSLSLRSLVALVVIVAIDLAMTLTAIRAAELGSYVHGEMAPEVFVLGVPLMAGLLVAYLVIMLWGLVRRASVIPFLSGLRSSAGPRYSFISHVSSGPTVGPIWFHATSTACYRPSSPFAEIRSNLTDSCNGDRCSHRLAADVVYCSDRWHVEQSIQDQSRNPATTGRVRRVLDDGGWPGFGCHGFRIRNLWTGPDLHWFRSAR